MMIFSPLFVKSKMNKKLHEICKKEFQIAKRNVRLLQNAKRFCKMQDAIFFFLAAELETSCLLERKRKNQHLQENMK